VSRHSTTHHLAVNRESRNGEKSLFQIINGPAEIQGRQTATEMSSTLLTKQENEHLLQEEHDNTTSRTGKDDHNSDDDSTYGSLDLSSSEERSHPSSGLTTALEQEGQAAETPSQVTEQKKDVRWRDLPRKDQLLILTLARLAEPIAQTGIQSYIFFMLKSFDESLSDASISQQAGFLSGGFTMAQCVTAVWWGRFADREWLGRKNVLIIGLVGTLISTLGFAFSKSFMSLMFWRCLGGVLNGNVGVMRTMISEIIKEKKFQPKAFLILPLTFNVGVL
jgi:hypothetical protein